jgi:hypothetical protein
MKRSISTVVLGAALFGALSGCAGSTEADFDYTPFAGTYETAFTRSTGTMTISVATNGQITITIVDSVEGTFCGTGIANHVGGFFITCNGANNKQVSVNGTLRGTGVGRTAQGTIAGQFSVPYNAAFTRSPDVTIYSNHYEGSYVQGTSSGNWFGDVASNGSFSGTLLVTGGADVSMTGNVYSNGSFKFTGTGGGKSYVAMGNFRLSGNNIKSEGTLKSTAGTVNVTGDWNGQNFIGG